MFCGINGIKDGFSDTFPSDDGEKAKKGLELLYLLKKSYKDIMPGWHKSMKFGFVKYLKLHFREDSFEKLRMHSILLGILPIAP